MVRIHENNSELIFVLRQRIKLLPCKSTVSDSLPVLFFGDPFTASVATIGLNPSKNEYLDRDGSLLMGKRKRFESCVSLGSVKRDQLNADQADQAIETMRCYFDPGKPVYGSYFRHLRNFMIGMNASYERRKGVHLDLVQEVTDPVWSSLCTLERSRLLEQDIPFQVWQLENFKNLEVVVCAGKTVSNEVIKHLRVDIIETGKMKRLSWWLGLAYLAQRNLRIGGWNYPLDRPTGLGTDGEIQLGELFRRSVV